MKIKCDLAKDLIPLYIENLCSDYTKNIVEEHLSDCQNCNHLLNDLKETNINEENLKKSIEPFKKVNRKNLLITISSVLGVIIFISIIYINLFIIGSVAPISMISVTHIQMLDEMTFDIEIYSNEKSHSINNIYLMPSDNSGNVYIKVNQVLVSPFHTSDNYKTSFGFDKTALGNDKIKAVYLVGKDKNDIKLIWKE